MLRTNGMDSSPLPNMTTLGIRGLSLLDNDLKTLVTPLENGLSSLTGVCTVEHFAYL